MARWILRSAATRRLKYRRPPRRRATSTSALRSFAPRGQIPHQGQRSKISTTTSRNRKQEDTTSEISDAGDEDSNHVLVVHYSFINEWRILSCHSERWRSFLLHPLTTLATLRKSSPSLFKLHWLAIRLSLSPVIVVYNSNVSKKSLPVFNFPNVLKSTCWLNPAIYVVEIRFQQFLSCYQVLTGGIKSWYHPTRNGFHDD